MISAAEVVVIRGGVHGASLAFHLARAKAGKVVLVEKKHLSAGPYLSNPVVREFGVWAEAELRHVAGSALRS